MQFSRRSFARFGIAGLLPPVRGAPLASDRPRVVVARARGAVKIEDLLDRAMQSFFSASSPLDAWRRIVRPGETVGLKVNCLAGKGGSTSPALVEVICGRLQQAGIRRQDIIVWDRLSEDLESAGFRISRSGDRIQVMGNEILGYENELSVYGSAGSRLARTLTRLCDAVINLPLLKDHGIVGVTMALKNMFGAIHNPNKYHPNAGDPYIADVNMIPAIRSKVRLTICEAVRAQYEGGPTFMPQWTWPFNGLLVAQDPVALDTVGWRIIEEKRAQERLPSLRQAGRAPNYIATAADPAHRLGVDDPRRIERVEA